MNYYYIIIIAIVIIVAVASGVYFFYKKPKVSYIKSGSTNPEIEIYFFFTDWCPHCKTAKPEWEHVKTTYDGTKMGNYTVKFIDVNCTKDSAEIQKLTSTYKIEGYPTVKLVKDNEVIEYDAKPERSALINFLESSTV